MSEPREPINTPPEEFRVEEPLPTLVLSFESTQAGEANGALLEDRIRTAVDVFSDAESGLRGTGLSVFHHTAGGGRVTVTLVARTADGAREAGGVGGRVLGGPDRRSRLTPGSAGGGRADGGSLPDAEAASRVHGMHDF